MRPGAVAGKLRCGLVIVEGLVLRLHADAFPHRNCVFKDLSIATDRLGRCSEERRRRFAARILPRFMRA